MDLGKIVKKSVEAQNMLAWQFNTIGVSDGITMGSDGELPHTRIHILHMKLKLKMRLVILPFSVPQSAHIQLTHSHPPVQACATPCSPARS